MSSNSLPVTSVANKAVASKPVSLIPGLRNLLQKKLIPALSDVESKTHSNPLLVAIWKKLGLPPLTTASFGAGILLLLVRKLFQKSPMFLSNLFGTLLPAYYSIKAINANTEKDEKEIQSEKTQIFTYWSLYGLITLLDPSADAIIEKVRFYYLPKLALIYYLWFGKGAQKLYLNILQPFLAKYGGYSTITSTISRAPSSTDTFGKAYITKDTSAITPPYAEPVELPTEQV